MLVVDDEEPLARLVGSYLERDGFEVALAFDGLSGIAQARSMDPDVVVLDLGLPGIGRYRSLPCRAHLLGLLRDHADRPQ